MKRLIVLLLLLAPLPALAAVSGMDDVRVNVTQDIQDKLDNDITTYYQAPSLAKVEEVLDIINDSDLLRKKTSWAPMVGFLTVIFADNKQHLFTWMGRNAYNNYAQQVILSALVNAHLKETALVFAQAHQWTEEKLYYVRIAEDDMDLKHLAIGVPGHIDTLWGAFFASGDITYVNEIIGALLAKTLPNSSAIPVASPYNLLEENKKLAESTLRQYAPYHEPVRAALKAHIATEKDPAKKRLLESILTSGPPDNKK